MAKKDLNFLNNKKNYELQVFNKDYELFIKTIKFDCDFFANNNIIDYSLLLGVHKIGNQIKHSESKFFFVTSNYIHLFI